MDTSQLSPARGYRGEDAEDTKLVAEMLELGRSFLARFEWCGDILEEHVGLAIGGVVAVFLMRIEPAREGVDEWLWVIVGDVPPAYFVTDAAPNGACALDAYVDRMAEWVETVDAGSSVDELIPVTTRDGGEWLEPNAENANMLRSRLESLEEFLAANWASDLRECAE